MFRVVRSHTRVSDALDNKYESAAFAQNVFERLDHSCCTDLQHVVSFVNSFSCINQIFITFHGNQYIHDRMDYMISFIRIPICLSFSPCVSCSEKSHAGLRCIGQ